MRQAITLSIPMPCHEQWGTMQPLSVGRHCASCQKVVQDFTQFSDAELVSWFAQQQGLACGRFLPEQLTRPLPEQAQPSQTGWLRWVVALVLGWQSANGQGGPPKADLVLPPMPAASAPSNVEVVAPQPKTSLPAVRNDSTEFYIHGQVTDTQGEPLPGVSVVLRNTMRGMLTDATGNFSFPIRVSDKESGHMTLQFSFIGLLSQEVAVSTRGDQGFLTVRLNEDTNILLGEVTVTNYTGSTSILNPINRILNPIRRLFIKL